MSAVLQSLVIWCSTIKIQSNSTEDRCLLCCKALSYDAAPSRSSQTVLKIDVSAKKRRKKQDRKLGYLIFRISNEKNRKKYFRKFQHMQYFPKILKKLPSVQKMPVSDLFTKGQLMAIYKKFLNLSKTMPICWNFQNIKNFQNSRN